MIPRSSIIIKLQHEGCRDLSEQEIDRCLEGCPEYNKLKADIMDYIRRGLITMEDLQTKPNNYSNGPEQSTESN